MKQSDKMFKIFSRPNINIKDVRKFEAVESYIQKENLDDEVIEQAEIQIKYSGYIQKEKNNEQMAIEFNAELEKLNQILHSFNRKVHEKQKSWEDLRAKFRGKTGSGLRSINKKIQQEKRKIRKEMEQRLKVIKGILLMIFVLRKGNQIRNE